MQKEPEVMQEDIVDPPELEEITELDSVEDVQEFSDSMAELISEMVDESQSLETELLVVTPVSSPVLLQGITMVTPGTGEGPGGGLGKVTQFMGQQAQGTRFAFVIDYSKSMSRTQLSMMKHELYSAVETVGEQGLVSLLFFSGPVWRPDQDAKEAEDRWAGSNGKGWYLKEGAMGPDPRWLLPTRKNLAALLRMIHTTPTTYGTDWYPPLKLALEMNPRPDVVFFMTDGSCPKTSVERTLELVKSLPPRSVQINTVALGVSEQKVEGLHIIAEMTGGSFKHYDEATLKEQAAKLPDPPDSFRDVDLAYLSDTEVHAMIHRAQAPTASNASVVEENEIRFRIE